MTSEPYVPVPTPAPTPGATPGMYCGRCGRPSPCPHHTKAPR